MMRCKTRRRRLPFGRSPQQFTDRFEREGVPLRPSTSVHAELAE